MIISMMISMRKETKVTVVKTIAMKIDKKLFKIYHVSVRKVKIHKCDFSFSVILTQGLVT